MAFGNPAVAGNAASSALLPFSDKLLSTTQPPTRPASVGSSDFDGIIETAVSDALKVPEASQWSTISVKPGQNLSVIFEALGLAHDEVADLLSLGSEVQRLKKIKSGDELHVRVEDDRLAGLTYALDERRTLEIRRGDRGLEAVTLTAEIEHRQTTASGSITDSLFVDGRRAKLSSRLIMSFADIFGYDIDFAQDLHAGDHFSVVYEQLYKNGKKLRDGDILAAEFVSQGQRYRAVRFTAPDGNTAYYTPNGQSLRKAFIRTPVDFARISSPFNLRRLHPILHTIRAHKGVDYAAGTGTPIKATGDGKISFKGAKNGYGNVIAINHGAGVETLYAHLSRFRSGMSNGSRVRQGQVIGYVGKSGLATAPHLHYEFRINGIHKNPITVPLPRANPVSPRHMAAFRSQSSPLMAALDQTSTKLASVKTRSSKR
ncbi:MAG: peptidoglycan DD-metalloendopeptidase family protein [Pseudomonadota bacterium]